MTVLLKLGYLDFKQVFTLNFFQLNSINLVKCCVQDKKLNLFLFYVLTKHRAFGLQPGNAHLSGAGKRSPVRSDMRQTGKRIHSFSLIQQKVLDICFFTEIMSLNIVLCLFT